MSVDSVCTCECSQCLVEICLIGWSLSWLDVYIKIFPLVVRLFTPDLSHGSGECSYALRCRMDVLEY